MRCDFHYSNMELEDKPNKPHRQRSDKLSYRPVGFRLLGATEGVGSS